MTQTQRYEYEAEIIDIIPTSVTENIYVLDIGERPFAYQMGQFLTISFDPKVVLKYAEERLNRGDIKKEDFERIKTRVGKTSREYSLCNPPSRPGYLEIMMERIEGGSFTPWFIDNMKVGDKVKINGPLGRFFFNEKHKNVCFLAGGSGITPLMSMIRNIVDSNLDGKYVLIYSNRTRQHIGYRMEIDEIAHAKKNLHVFHTLTRLGDGEKRTWKGYTRRIDVSMVKECLEKVGMDPKDCYYYMCGSPGFMKAVCNPASRVNPAEPKGCLDELGVGKERIMTELF